MGWTAGIWKDGMGQHGWTHEMNTFSGRGRLGGVKRSVFEKNYTLCWDVCVDGGDGDGGVSF